MSTVSISSAKTLAEKIIMSTINTGVHMPVFLHSSPGIGKSSIVNQIAKEHDLGFVDVRLAQMEQSDVAGIPYVSHGGGITGAGKEQKETMAVSIPEWFPTQERIDAGDFKQKGILFFDELSNAPIPVQHAAYRVILDREVHRGVALPDGWAIVSAGNTKADKTGAKGVAPALANRFATHLTVRADVDDFRSYAVSQGFDDTVIGFISFAQDKLYNFDPKKNDVAFATPRSWEQVSNLLGVGFSEEEMSVTIAGCVGEGVAGEYMAFRKYYAKLPDFEKIMKGEATYKIPTEKGVVFAVTSSLISCLVTHGNDAKRVKNLDKLLTQLDDDFLMMIYKTLSSAVRQDAALVSNILANTIDTYRRISKYVKMENS